jgi:hypothetical protein
VPIPDRRDGDFEEIDLQHIQEHIDSPMSQLGFEAPHSDDEEPEILGNNYDDAPDIRRTPTPNNHQQRPIAWNWREPPRFRPYTPRRPRICPKCHAILFTGETNSLCCRNGRIRLPHSPPPPELLQIFKDANADHSERGHSLIRNIRLINSNFAFTSLGLNSDTRLALENQGQGVYTFKVKGTIHHRIGSLLPSTQEVPKFLQLYIYDNENEFENRQVHGAHIPASLARSIQSILHETNPLIRNFESMASAITPNRQIRLTDNAFNVDQRVYNLPRGDQIAAIWVEGMFFTHI